MEKNGTPAVSQLSQKSWKSNDDFGKIIFLFLAQRKNRVGDVHENGFHAASPAKERLDEGFISITPVIASSTLSRKASGRRFFPFAPIQ